MTSSLQTDVSWDGVVATVTVTGELDITAARALRRRLLEVASAHPERLVLNFGGLVLVDGAGAKVLDNTHKYLEARRPVVVRRLPTWSGKISGCAHDTDATPARAPIEDLSDRLETARAQAAASYKRARELWQQTEDMLADNQMLRQEVRETCQGRPPGPARRELLQRSPYARLEARLQTMPVIEQAKGIIMAQSACSDAEAFDMLRRASQRSNVPVRELAVQLVAKSAGTAVSAATEPRDPVTR
jgi:anti-anti-sigma regulatory factor